MTQNPEAQALSLQPSERAVWSSRLHSRFMLFPVAALIISGLVVLFAPDVPTLLGVALLVAGFAALSLATIGVTAGPTGVRVKYGVLPWPATTIDIDDIASASVVDVRPKDWGGWGYRGTLKMMGKAAVVLQAGPGLRLDLNDGRTFVVTIDNPETPAAVLNTELSRQQSSST